MVSIIDTIPNKQAQNYEVPKARPTITGKPGNEIIQFDGLVLPQIFNRRLLNRCHVDIKQTGLTLGKESVIDRIEHTNHNKDLFLRYANDKPLALVTEQFKDYDPRQIAKDISKRLGTKPTIRYFKSNESLQMNFPIESRFSGLYVVVSTGPYGVYGGSGSNAIKYGISWFNKTCSNWTMFLGRDLMRRKGRIIHRICETDNKNINAIVETADNLAMEIEESKSNIFDRCDLEKYFNAYINLGMPDKIKETIVKENPNWVSAYDLSYRLTQLCQDPKLSDVTRARVEYLAGEVILCYDRIMQNILDNTTTNIRRASGNLQLGQLKYVAK